MALTFITVELDFRDLDGSDSLAPGSGQVLFQLVSPLLDAAGKQIVSQRTWPVTLNNGQASVDLPATNDPTTSPSGLTYRVTERLTGIPERKYFIELDHAGGATQYLSDLAHSTAVASNSYVLASTYNALLTALNLQVRIVDGDAFVANNIWQPGFAIPYATTLTTLSARVGTAPVGADLIITVDVNGTLVGTITVADGATSGSTTISQDVVAGDITTFNVTSIGSSTPGADIVVTLVGV